MRVKLKKELEFIHKSGLKEFSVEEINGRHVIKEGNFKQNIKGSEYKLILECRIPEVEKVNEKVKKTERNVKASRQRKPVEKKEEPEPEKQKDPLEDDF
jgi:hypothetical protein